MMPEILAQSRVIRHWERTIILTIFAIIKDRRGKGWLKTKKMSYKLLVGKSGCDRTQIWEVRKRLIRAGIFSIKDLPGELADEWTYLGIPEGWDKNWSDEVRRPKNSKQDVVPVEHDVALNNFDVVPVAPISEDSIRGLPEDLKTEDSIYRISTLNIKRCSRHSIRGVKILPIDGNLSIKKLDCDH